MALDNLISIAFTQQEIIDLQTHLDGITTILAGKVINLTPDERQRYARVSYEMIPWVQKNHGYMKTNPSLVPSYIDTVEFDKDMKARMDADPFLTQLRSSFESFDDTMLLIGNDLYNNCIAFYQAVKAASKANVAGSTSIYQDLAQQFPGRPRKVKPEVPPTP